MAYSCTRHSAARRSWQRAAVWIPQRRLLPERRIRLRPSGPADLVSNGEAVMRKLVTVFTIIAFLAGCSGLPFAPVQQESLSQHLDKVKSNLSALPADIVHSPNPLWTALTSTDLLGVCMVADIATTADRK